MKFYQKHRKLSTWILAFILVASLILFKEILAAVPAALLAIRNLLSILSPFIAGFMIAFVLYVPCSKIEKLLNKAKKPNFFSKHSRGISVFTVYILFVAIIAVVLALVIPWLVKNLINLYNNRSLYYMTVIDFIYARCDESGKLFGIDPNPIIELLNPDRYLSKINLEQLTSIANGVYKFGSAIVETVLAVFSSVYMLLGRERLMRSFGRFMTLFMKRKTVSKTHSYLCKIADIFYTYIYSTLIDALIVATACTIAFLIIGIDYAPLFGFLVGIANLVPYFGAIIAGVGVSVFTAITGGIIPALITAAAVLVIQQIDGNIIQPKVVGKSVGISPLYTLIAITLGSGLFGYAGILLGVPVAATLRMFISDILLWNESRIALKEKEETAENQEE